MEGTASSPRNWMLASALVLTLLASHNEWVEASYRPNAGRGQFWQCPKCRRIEWKAQRRQIPVCSGQPGSEHDPVETDSLGNGNLNPTDNRHLFE